MDAYLIDNPPARQQFYKTRRKTGVPGDPLTGCTVLHTAESLMDTVGPDTGAENVAAFIRTRSTPGSYHDLVDSDSVVHLVPYESAAFHDGTGSNNWALSISFACSTADWKRMSAEKRAAFLRNGARAFAAQQAWRRAHGYPLTELRYITKAQSDAGQSGFCCHGWRDPGRRSDPGTSAPNEFPFDEFLTHCRAALAGNSTSTPSKEDDMPQAVTTQIHPGDDTVFAFPPAGPDGGAAGWGAAWLTITGDRFGGEGGPINARIALRGADGVWRGLNGGDMNTVLPVGLPVTVALPPGTNAAVFSDTDGALGVCVEYAKA